MASRKKSRRKKTKTSTARRQARPRAVRVDRQRAIDHLLDLLSVEGLSGQEGQVAEVVKEKLIEAGCDPSWIRHDRAHKQIPGDFEIGNLIVKIPGSHRGPRLLFMGHLDTVPLCRGAVPWRKGNRIVSEGETALGGDNRTAVGSLIMLAETLLERELPHPPLTLLFTVGEEIGLWGARTVEPRALGNPAMGFNVDHGSPSDIVIGAIGADRWEADVYGIASHAGVHPEEGISATLIASRAIADAAERGYFGKIEMGARSGTANVGVFEGGEATNQVTDHVFVKGESRSHNEKFLARITDVYRRCFERAAGSVKASSGETGWVDFHAERDYDAFRMARTAPPVKLAATAIRALRREPEKVIANGGLDANYLNAKGVPTVTLGAGQHKPHTIDEYVDVKEYVDGCRLLVTIATNA